MARTRTLLVPIRIDGLYVDSAGLSSGRRWRTCSKLPYDLADGKPWNNTSPNLAESAFDQDDPLAYPKGLHLHWALPDALAICHHRDGSTVFPAVPNRWLVRRLDPSGQLQTWMLIVESDYLHP